MTVASLILFVCYFGISLYAGVLALVRQRGFPGTLLWVLAIVALPVAGAIAYFLLANPNVRRTRLMRQQAAEILRGANPPIGAPSALLARLSPTIRSLLRLGDRLSDLPATAGNQLELLTDNVYAFRKTEDAIRAAKKTIWAEHYMIKDDETGRRFLDLLIERARSGIDVRLLYDAVGSSRIDLHRLDRLRGAGGRVEAFLPPNPLRRRWAVHLRNHRKVMLVDGQIGFLGGMNIGNEYSGHPRRKQVRAWRDTHVVLEGPAVRELALIFAEDWYFTTDERLELPPSTESPSEGSLVSILPSGPDQEANATGLIYFATIAAATERCYITTPYFVPDEATVRALESAALRGVDVRLLVPERSDVPIARLAGRSYYRKLLSAGVRIFEYRPAMLHAKTVVADSQICLIGSANLDMRSFRLNFEVSALVYDPRFASELELQYHADLASSIEISERSLTERFFGRLSEGAAQMLSPLL